VITLKIAFFNPASTSIFQMHSYILRCPLFDPAVELLIQLLKITIELLTILGFFTTRDLLLFKAVTIKHVFPKL
jgi:hypothetical protein